MKKFLIELLDIFRERFSSIIDAVRQEWRFYALRAYVWREERHLAAIEGEDEDTNSYVGQKYMELEPVTDWMRTLETKKLLREAAKYGVEPPPIVLGEYYDRMDWNDDHSESYYLTDKGMRHMRLALREPRKERREAAGFWFGIVVGVIGALTGLAAVLK